MDTSTVEILNCQIAAFIRRASRANMTDENFVTSDPTKYL